MSLRIDLTKTKPAPLVIEHLPSGAVIRFTFHKVFTRQQRAFLTKEVGKGFNKREVSDIKKLFREGVESIEFVRGVEMDGVNGPITDSVLIVSILDTPENLGGLPEEVVAKVTAYVLGENILGEDEGNG